MEATIVNFRRGRHHTNPRQIIIKVANAKSPQDLIKKTVTWTSSSKKEIKGTISSKHGNKDCFRVIFPKALPGQSIGTKVVIS